MPQQPYVDFFSNNSKSNSKASKKEIEEVLNLPDNLGAGKKKDGYSGPNLNDELLKEFNKKKVLKNLNEKIMSDEHARKPASELHGDRMIVPRDEQVF